VNRQGTYAVETDHDARRRCSVGSEAY